jgi:mannose-6-phosphate isomerase-like protein (cupin superfamily)
MTLAARSVIGSGDGAKFKVGPDTMTAKVMSPDDHFSLIEYESIPGVPGPPLHVHHGNEEVFFILDGEIDFSLEGTTTRVGRGACVHVPKGKAHAFVNAGMTNARWVGIFTPGRFQGLVAELGSILPPDGPPDPATLAVVFSKWDTELVKA